MGFLTSIIKARIVLGYWKRAIITGEIFVEMFLAKSEQIYFVITAENNLYSCVQCWIENLLRTEMIFLVFWKTSCCPWKYSMIFRYLLWDIYNAKNIHLSNLSAFIIHILSHLCKDCFLTRGGKEIGKDCTRHHCFFHTTVLCSLTFRHPSRNFHKR